MLKKYISFLFALFFATTLLRCASAGAPQGGPRDSLPPTFLNSDPIPYSKNFNGKRVTLTFNEYVQLKDQNKLFFMSPPAQKKPLLSIKGKQVLVDFQEPLDSNATYRLDFGSSIVDNNEGNKLDNFSVVFATGDVLDTLIMAGQVLDAFSRDTIVGAFMFFFDKSADSMVQDSTMYKARAEALFRSDSSGYFIADILKDKDYRLYALADENTNQLYEAGIDKIGFFDTVFNPTLVDPFYMQYDELRKRWNLDSLKVIAEVFLEEPPKRQTLLEHKRPLRHKLTIAFNAPDAQIDTLKLDSIPDNWLIKKWNSKRDSLEIWIAPETKEQFESLKDTIRGRIAFQKQDSVWNYYSNGQDLVFAHKMEKPKEKKVDKKLTETKTKVAKNKKAKRKKRLKRGEILPDNLKTDSMMRADSLNNGVGQQKQATDTVATEKERNPFKVNVKASKEFVPTNDMIFEFEFPLTEVDKKGITLKNFPKVMKKGKLVAEENPVGVPVKFDFVADTSNILKYTLKADWAEEVDYELTILPNVFKNIAFQTNDTLSSKFTVSPKNKFGTVILKTHADSTYNGCYIIQLITKSAKEEKVERQFKVPNDKREIKMEYLAPGKFRIKLIEDANCNQKWDTGDLVKRKKPEKVRLYRDRGGVPEVLSKENWTIEIDIKYNEIFGR